MKPAIAALCGCVLALGCGVGPSDELSDPGGKADDPSELRDPVASIVAWNAELSEADRRAKYCRMAESAFVFYRGSNHLYWADLGLDPGLGEFGSDRTRTWLQGDMHVENFGAFANDDDALVYSLNDFDESVIGDYQLDLWRMAVSLVLVTTEAETLTANQQRDVLDEFVETYLDAMDEYRGNRAETEVVLDGSVLSRRVGDLLDKIARKESRAKLLDKWTVVSGEARRLDIDSDKLEPLADAEVSMIDDAMFGYGETLSGRLDFDTSYFAFKSAARRVLAGTGSLGRSRYYVLIEGETLSLDDDRVLDVKRQTAPAPIVFLGADARGEYDASFDNHAQRHATAYKALMNDTDDHLGWMELADGFYSVREVSFAKKSFPVDELDSKRAHLDLAADWGRILATTHARADKDFDDRLVPHSVDKEISIATDGRHNEVRALVAQIAFEYAEQVSTDWDSFLEHLAPADCDPPSADAEDVEAD